MNISEELIRELQRRIDVSYEEAESYLKKTKGDVNMAVFLIMKKNDSSWERFKVTLNDMLKYRFIMTRRGETLINLPLLILAIFIFLYGIQQHLFPLILIVIIALLTECEVKIQKYKHNQEQEGSQTHYGSKQYGNHAQYENQAQSVNQAQPGMKTQPERANKPIKQATPVRQSSGKPIKVTEKQQPSNNIDEADNDFYEIVIEE